MSNEANGNGYVKFKLSELKSAIVVLVKVLSITGAAVGGGFLADSTIHKPTIPEKLVEQAGMEHAEFRQIHNSLINSDSTITRQTRKLEAWQLYNTCLFRRYVNSEPSGSCNELQLIYPEIRELIQLSNER